MRVPSLPQLLVAASAIALITSPAFAQRGGGRGGAGGATAVQPPRFDYVGPDNGGRIASVAGIPGDTMTYYFGAASGGVWKTTDGARTFAPVFDDQTSQAIGALAVAPSSPRTVWAGTGEAWAIRDADVMGDGIYKSTDAGATWTNMGLKEVGRIGKIIVHPTDANLVYVCALGRATGPQQERGVFRTKDGGTNWERVLFVNENTGCSGLSIDRTHPENLVAGTWEVVMKTFAMTSGGAGSGVYVSHDSGSTWTRATDAGLPKSPLGKIDVAIAPSNSKRIYALIQTPDQGSVWRSDDGGNKWKVVSWDRSLIGRAGYYIRIDVNPENDLEVLVANSTFKRSYDGGETWPIIDRGCGDCHDIWMDPRNPSHYVITGDGGAGITTNHGVNFTQFALPIGQMYHVAIDDQMPYWIYANKQDDSRSVRAPSSARMQVANVPSYARGGAPGAPGAFGGFGGGGGRGGAAASPWVGPLGGCESGFTIPQPGNSDIVWATCYGNTVTRYDDKIGEVHSVSPWRHTLDFEPNNSKYRCHWTPPLAIDPFDPKTVYYGCQVIFKTQNAGQSWSVISPDLSTQDSRYVISSGGIVGDNLGQFYGEVVFAIAPSEKQRGLIWAGTNDGKIWNTTDGGTKWNDLTKNVNGLAPWGTIRKIEPSRFDAGTAYVVVDYHMMDDRKPYIYKTADYGKSWSLISASLPQDHPLSYAMSVAENPNRKGMLFAGTGHQIFYSLDDGAKWTELKAGLPASPATWITINKQQHDLVVSTYGRGLWVLRDMTMLEQSDKQVADSPLRIYEPRPGLRQARSGSAEVTFTLKEAPKDSLNVQIADSSGAVIRTIRTMARVGTNRVMWDLRYDSPMQPELRATPVDNPHIWDEPRYKENKKTRIVDHWGIAGVQRAGALAAPGKYSVKISAAGATVIEPFVVIKDPKLTTSASDLVAATGAQVRAVTAINGSVDLINRIEIMRKQIEDLVANPATSASDRAALLDQDKRALAVELLLLSKAELNSDDKWFTERHKLYMSLLWLSAEVGTGAGDVAGGAEYRPTDAQSQTLGELEKDLVDAKAAFAKFMGEVKAFNAAHAGVALSDALKAEKPKPAILP